jgi:GH43 family beta-xylosidase/acetyl esterase/lipase
MHRLLLTASVLLGVLLAGLTAPAAAPTSYSTPGRLLVWPAAAPLGNGQTETNNATITVHHPARTNGTAVVICPGGGYGGLVVGAEGHGIARWLNTQGITGVVLEYRLPAGRPFVPLLDAQRALRIARANARSWGLNPERIGIMGFSAGGHLAATAGTHFDAGDPQAGDPVARVSCRPDFMILIYPVINMGAKAHGACKFNLLGGNPTPDLVELFSNEKQVTARTPPAFLAHAQDDRVVSPEHSQDFYDALQRQQVAAKYLKLPSGGHGLNGYQGPMWTAWQTESLAWLAAQKLAEPIAPISADGASQAPELPPGKFQNPINPGPDPFLVVHEGNYYLTTTQGDAIRVWKAPTLASLKTAPRVTVWKDAEPSRSRGLWAPETHFISNRWYLYYTAMASDNNDASHRMHVLESAGADPLGPYAYKGRLVNPTNDHYAIDGSVFQTPDGSWYFLWAAQPGHVLTIARLANPWTLQGHGVVLPASGFGCAEVREGPVVLRRNGRLFLTYSACDTGKPDYKLGMLVADEAVDVLNPLSWKQHPVPVFERHDAHGVFGPGHHAFFRSPDGMEDWIIYHAKTSSAYTYRGRTTRAQKFTWHPDGTPDFGVPLSLDTILDEPSNRSSERKR